MVMTVNVIDSLVFKLTIKRLETRSKLNIIDSVEVAAQELIAIYHSELIFAQEYSGRYIFVFDSELFSNDKTLINDAI